MDSNYLLSPRQRISRNWSRFGRQGTRWKSGCFWSENLQLIDSSSQSNTATTTGKLDRPFLIREKGKLRETLHYWGQSISASSLVLLNGKAQHIWPPCSNKLISAHFYYENIIYLLYKTSYLTWEVNCTEPSPSLRVLWPCILPLCYTIIES